MKKLLLLLVASLTMLFVGCSQFDDTRIWDAIDELEEEQEKMQEQIDAQQTLLNALANNLSIVSITPTAEGFLLTFSDGSTITVKHGEKGDKGDTGEKGEQGEKGDKGDTGKKGEDGADGKDGQDGKDGADGDSLFQSVTWDEEYAYFTLSDGTVIKIPLASDSEAEEGDLPPANEIWYTSTDGEVVTPYGDAFGVYIISNTYENGVGIITFDGDVTSIGYWAFGECESLVSIVIPDSVTSIGDYAFYNCSSLASVTIPDSVTEIGIYAFNNCSSLASVTIPDSITSIGEGAFQGCSSLASVTIPDSVTSIGDYAFAYCSSLASVTIPDSVTSIGRSAFSDCSSLASVTIPDSVTEIGSSAFTYCSSLTSVTIPYSVTSIGKSAFYGCSSLASITIPESVTSIGEHAFSGCTSLTSITIPDSVTSIGDYAFYYCPSLTSVYCKPTTPPSGGGSWMFAGNASGRKIYVPTESVEAYKTADGWSDYADYIEPYNFGGGEGNAGVKEVAAVSLFGMYAVWYNFYMILGYVSSGEDAGYNLPMDSWNYEFYIISDTEPVNDEIPLGTYTYVDYEKLASGEEELKTGIFTVAGALDMWCTYVDANGEMQEYKYTEGTMVVSEGKIELTVTLDNGEVHHVVYEGSLQTWGEGA